MSRFTKEDCFFYFYSYFYFYFFGSMLVTKEAVLGMIIEVVVGTFFLFIFIFLDEGGTTF